MRKGLTDISSTDYRPFFIYRYLCKGTGRTISMHPDFSHSYKRFTLESVLLVLQQHLIEEESIYRLCRENGYYLSTLRRWLRGFGCDFESKRLCFLPFSTASPGKGFTTELFRYFISSGGSNISAGAALGMVRLHREFNRSLY